MRRASTLVLGLIVLLAAACGDGDDIQWTARFDGSETSGNSAGGASIGASGTLTTLPESPWFFDLPVPFPGTAPPTDLEAVGQALLIAGPDREVLDARSAPLGTVALLRDPAGGMELVFLGPDGARAAPAPENAEQIVPAGEEPLRIWVLLPDGLATLATLVY